MDLTVVSVETTTRTRELTSRAPRVVSSPPTGFLLNLTDPSQVIVDLSLREPRRKSGSVENYDKTKIKLLFFSESLWKDV